MRAAVLLSKVLARLHRWYGAAWILSRVSLAQLDSHSVGRLLYSLMMASRADRAGTHALLASVVRRNANTTPELRIELAAMATAVDDSPLAETLLVRAAGEATEAPTTDAAKRLLTVSRTLADGSLAAQVEAMVGALDLPAGAELLTLVPLSGRYLDLWQLWLEQVRKHIGGVAVVMVLDDAAEASVHQESGVVPLDVREFFAWEANGSLHPRSRGVLWVLRVLILRELVQRGHATLVLDLDAIAVSDLAPMFASLPTADVIAQKDHSLPMDVNREVGFVLCCGFMLWRPGGATLALLERFARETAIERDDQMALNHMLARDGLTDRTKSVNSLSFFSAGVRFVCPDASLVSRTLYSGNVVRHFQQEGKSTAELRETLGLSSKLL